MPVRAEQGRLIDRRTVLKCAGAIGLGAALGRDRRSSQRVSAQESLEPEKPSLRQEITTFEKTHAENPTDPDLQQLVGMYGQLFTDTFGVQAQPTPRIQIATPDDLYSIGYNNQNPYQNTHLN